MSSCQQAGCANTDLKCYKLALRQHFVLLCGPCAADLSAMGLALTPVERRETTMAVLHERRRTFRPRWLGRAKVLDNGTVAA